MPWMSPHYEAVLLQMAMDSNEVLPRHFDAATKWPGMIHEPLDQGNCAGSWAFSTAGETQWDGDGGWTGGGGVGWDPRGLPASLTAMLIPSRRLRPHLHPFHGAHDALPVAPKPPVL